MHRDWSGLSRASGRGGGGKPGHFDLLIVGGGIYGAWIAYDAALRGYSVALVEKTDWAAGTSSASSKLIHGGLRYLEQFNFGLVQHALTERATLNRIAPHAVDPVRFMIPSYEDDRVPRWKLRAGLTLYDLLAGRGQPTRRHQKFSAAELKTAFPFLETDGLRGGFAYGDCQEDDARLTLEVVASAQDAGAVVCNHAGVTDIVQKDGRVTGAMVRCQLTGEPRRISARLTINAAGPWAAKLLKPLGAEVPPMRAKLVKGVHLMMPKLPGPRDAFLLTARSDGRVFFIIPWYDHTIIGTTESEFEGDPGKVSVTYDEAEYLIREACSAIKPANWSMDDLQGCFAGVRTLMVDDSASLSAISRDFHVMKPMPGIWMPVGGKYTTARGDAEGVIDDARDVLGPARRARRTSRESLAWAPAEVRDEASEDAWIASMQQRGEAAGLDARCAYWLAKRHGALVPSLLDLVRQAPALAERVSPGAPFCKAELVFAVRFEMAMRLDDIVRRRMPLTLMARPDRKLLEQVAAVVAPELGWTAETVADEVDLALKKWPDVLDSQGSH